MLPLPVPIQADDHETQGLMGSDESDTSPTLNNHPNLTNIPIAINNTTSLTSQNTPPANTSKPPQNRVSRRDVNKRIASYLRESDENCRESATLVAIVIIGLIVTGSVIGFLQLGHYDPSAIHKGSHASVTHFDGEELPHSLPDWLTKKSSQIDEEVKNNSLPTDDTLGIQPLYRNYLLQTIYEYSFQAAIRIDKNDPIFQHISMTYGGPWTVPPVPSNDNQRRSMQDNDDSDTERVVWDEQSNIKMISLENGRNDHTFSLQHEYVSNMNDWHCYIFEFANADKLVTNQAFWKDYSFKITASINKFDMESGYDFVRVYVNSQFKGQVFTGNIVQETVVYRVDFDYLNEWKEKDIPSFELCFNVITDGSVTGNGFDITTKIEYENPEIVGWSDSGGDDDCFVQEPTWRNPSRWDGSCGIGVRKKKIGKCDEDLLANLQIKSDASNENDELFESGLFRGVCALNEEQIRYCNKLDCGDATSKSQTRKNEIKSNPKLKYHYNGHGRIDPTYADPFDVYRSTNIAMNIEQIIGEIESMKSDIEGEFPDQRILTNSVQKHSKMDDSKIRLGLKLARSLLLGDTFHVVFTGSSNTAGHDNLFMSSYPMQLQSIMRPLWKRIGYKGAAFTVSNGAIGGAIGTNQMAWCIPAITGGNAEKIDVVFWESTMNDAGSDDSRKHTMEDHIRSSLSVYGGTYNMNMPNRPVWHAVIAGTNGEKPLEFDTKSGIYAGYKDLIETYSNYGAGIVEFAPFLGMNPMKKKEPQKWSDEHFYVTWHPGPVGHRIYAEIIAYFYLDAVLDVLNDVKKTVEDLEKELDLVIAKPVLEMLHLLQDAPYEPGLPAANGKKSKCKPLCTDAVHSYCMTGFNPKDNVYAISAYVVDANQWKYEHLAGNPQPIDAENGGQASIDTKYGYKGNKNSGALVLSVLIVGNNYLLIEKPYADWGGLNEILKKMSQWFTAQIIEVMDLVLTHPKQQGNIRDNIIKSQVGRKLKCETKNKQVWNKDFIEFGCVLKFEYSGKYKIALTVDTDDDIPISVIASF